MSPTRAAIPCGETLDEKQRRASIIHNQLLQATIDLLPATYRTEKISIAIDATRLKVFARGIGRKRLEAMTDEQRISVEPDFGFYRRDRNGKPVAEGEMPRILEYASEAELTVLTSNDPRKPGQVPALIMAFAEHVPGVKPVAAARTMIDSLFERGYDLDHVATDRAYMPAGDPKILQGFLRSHGARILMDYPKDELGVQAHARGAILVEGSWYCPSLPADLINATKKFRGVMESAEADKTLTEESRKELKARKEAEWKALLAQRSNYLVRAKQAMNANGSITRMCPASGPAPTVTCPLKPRTDAAVTGRALLPILTPPAAPGPLCTNKSSTTFALEDGGRFEQDYEFYSEDWETHYFHGRNQVESANAYIKDPNTFAMDQPGRRRMRGRTAQALLTLISLLAVNLKILTAFLGDKRERKVELELGITPPETRTRRSRRSTSKARIAHLRRRGKKVLQQ